MDDYFSVLRGATFCLVFIISKLVWLSVITFEWLNFSRNYIKTFKYRATLNIIDNSGFSNVQFESSLILQLIILGFVTSLQLTTSRSKLDKGLYLLPALFIENCALCNTVQKVFDLFYHQQLYHIKRIPSFLAQWKLSVFLSNRSSKKKETKSSKSLMQIKLNHILIYKYSI